MSSAPSFRSMLGLAPATASTADSTLIIIDAQNEYATGKLAVSNAAASRKVIASLLERYRAAEAPIIHVVHDTPAGAPVFTPGTELAEEFAELAPREGEPVVRKQFPGSFTGTELQWRVEETGRRKIVLVGYMVRFPGPSVCFRTWGMQPAFCRRLTLTLRRLMCASLPRPGKAARGVGMS